MTKQLNCKLATLLTMGSVKSRIFKSVYVLIYILCTGFFGVNIFVTITTYFNNQTIETATKMIPADEKVHLPIVAICLKNPFKDPNRQMLTLEDYDENTYHSNDSTAMFDLKSSNFKINNRFATWNQEYINTLLFGKCVLYEMNEKVK